MWNAHTREKKAFLVTINNTHVGWEGSVACKVAIVETADLLVCCILVLNKIFGAWQQNLANTDAVHW